jgi:hypothetical protein
MLQWVASIPASANPFVDATGALSQAAESGRVWFLMGPSQLLPQPQTGSLTVPAGTAIFLSPVALYAAGPGGIAGDGDDTPAQLLDFARTTAGFVTGVQVQIDGVPVAGIDQYRILSSTVALTTPDDNIYSVFFAEPNPFTFGNFAGFGLFINPLPPGVHVLHAVSEVPEFGLSFDMTYTITVGTRG